MRALVGVLSWRERAACAEHPLSVFFGAGTSKLARTLCAACPVRLDCLEDVLTTEPEGERFGFRGGLTSTERGRLMEQTLALYRS